jgi:hypothetical protein
MNQNFFMVHFLSVPLRGRIVLYITITESAIELGRQARPGRQTGIRLYRPVPAEGQNKSWGHRLTAKAISYKWRHLNNK